jgi:hypothetical protein
MLFEVSKETKIKAKNPHELFMVNLAVFHLLLAPISLVLIGGMRSLLVPIFFSCTVFAFIYFRGKAAEKNNQWFVMVHHKLAFRRATTLLIAYAVSAAIIGGGWLIGMTSDQKAMADIILTISTRIGVMPTFILVVINFALETSGVSQASKGEVPDSFLKKYPAPDDIQAIEPTN